MSDSEGNAQASLQPHANTGGKSIAAINAASASVSADVGANDVMAEQQQQPVGDRPSYKSYRKKYRKMRQTFDVVLEDNRTLFREEQKLEATARRLREDLDGLMDLLLDFNQNPALPPELRYDVALPMQHTAVGSIASVVPDNIEPEAAMNLFQEYTVAVQRGQIPHLDLHVIREQLDKKLAVQGISSFEELLATLPHSVPKSDLPVDLLGLHPPGFLTTDEEDAYLLRLDAKLGDTLSLAQAKEKEKDGAVEDKHWPELSTREIDRQNELLNPLSQHNWIKTHAKQPATGGDLDDNESLASHDVKPTPSRGGKAKRDLAKQVGDRAVGRAREEFSPGAASAGFGDEDELTFLDESIVTSSKKRAKGDIDGTYRAKGGKTPTGKGKRKRTADDTTTAGGKKAKTETTGD